MPQDSQSPAFHVYAFPDRARIVVSVSGDFELGTAGTVRDAMRGLLEMGWSELVLDVRKVTFIDSTGLSVLLEADHEARSNGHDFAIVDGSPAVARLLDVAGLSGHFARATCEELVEARAA